jgi:hypothetical protein
LLISAGRFVAEHCHAVIVEIHEIASDTRMGRPSEKDDRDIMLLADPQDGRKCSCSSSELSQLLWRVYSSNRNRTVEIHTCSGRLLGCVRSTSTDTAQDAFPVQVGVVHHRDDERLHLRQREGEVRSSSPPPHPPGSTRSASQSRSHGNS